MKSNLKPRLKKALPYIILLALVYLLLPICAIAAGSKTFYNLAPMLDCCCAMLIGYFYGKKASRDPIMPLSSAILFLPNMLIFFNITAWVYLPIAAFTCFLGQCFGTVSQKR